MTPPAAAVPAAPFARSAVRADDGAGAAVPTIAGDIANADRPGFDAGRGSVIDAGAGPAVFSGPRSVDALDAAGGAAPLATPAPGGFGTEISRAEVESRDWILATQVDGRPLGIGGRGPLWLVFDPPGDRPATEEEQGMWPWALFFIECGAG